VRGGGRRAGAGGGGGGGAEDPRQSNTRHFQRGRRRTADNVRPGECMVCVSPRFLIKVN